VKGEGIEPPDTVRKPLIHKKVQGAIGDRRLAAEPLGAELFQHVIGPERTMRLQQDFQHAPAHRRQPRAGRAGAGLGCRQDRRDIGRSAMIRAAKPVILCLCRHPRRLDCYDITLDKLPEI